MRLVQISIRVAPALDAAVIRFAQSAGITKYQAMIRAVETGVAELVGQQPAPAVISNDVTDALGEIQAHIAYLGRLADRSLYAAALAWAAARQSALRGEPSPDDVNQRLIDIGEQAYRRQVSQAREGASR